MYKGSWKTQWIMMLLISIKGNFFLFHSSSHNDLEFLLREIAQNLFLFIYWKKSIDTRFRFPLKQKKRNVNLETVIQRPNRNSKCLQQWKLIEGWRKEEGRFSSDKSSTSFLLPLSWTSLQQILPGPLDYTVPISPYSLLYPPFALPTPSPLKKKYGVKTERVILCGRITPVRKKF